MVRHQISAEYYGMFVQHQCRLVCVNCDVDAKEIVTYSDRDIVNHTSPDIQTSFRVSVLGMFLMLQ